MTRFQRACYIALSFLFALSVVWFCRGWFATAHVLPNNFAWSKGPDVIDLLLFVVLSVVILFPFWMAALGWIVAGRIKPTVTPPPFDDAPLRVAMITTYVPGAEPLEMLEDTLRNMIAVRDLPGWSHDTWVLDEGKDEAVRALAKRIGARYFTRGGVEELNTVGGKFSMKTKGGNHNAWYHEVGFKMYDIVSQWDTDFLVEPFALERIVPYFADPKVAWVGTPQVYDNLDNFIAKGAAEQTYEFYGMLNRGLSSENHSLMLGANHTVRVEALRSIGGYEAHLVEDLATGMRLHADGWESKYIPEALALGEGPTTWTAWFKQQYRWAKGCMDLFFTTSFKRASTMPKGMAALYLWMQQYYLGGLTFGASILLLLLNFGFGWHSTLIPFPAFLSAYVPLWLITEVMVLWLQQFNCRPRKEWGLYLRARVLAVVTMPVFLFAVCAAIRDRGKHTVFEVTPKGKTGVTISLTINSGPKWRPKKSVYTPHIVISTIAGLGLLSGLVLGHHDFVNVFWALVVAGSGVGLALSLSWIKIVALVRTRRLAVAERVHASVAVSSSIVDLEEMFLQ